MTGISPAQTDNSKTAATGEFSRKMIIDNTALVSASPTTERNNRVVITVHNAAARRPSNNKISIAILS